MTFLRNSSRRSSLLRSSRFQWAAKRSTKWTNAPVCCALTAFCTLLHTIYPANYGFIPRTYADDSDPLDVLVLCSESLDPLVMVDCIPIGCIRMIDEDSYDEKIIAIAREDPTWNFYQDLADLPPHIAQEIRHFFEIYKQLEHKHTTVLDTLPRDEAIQIVSSCMDRYQIHFCGKRPGHPSARAQELSKQLTP